MREYTIRFLSSSRCPQKDIRSSPLGVSVAICFLLLRLFCVFLLRALYVLPDLLHIDGTLGVPDLRLDGFLDVLRRPLELGEAAAQRLAQVGQLLRAEDDEGDDENDDQLRYSKTEHDLPPVRIAE